MSAMLKICYVQERCYFVLLNHLKLASSRDVGIKKILEFMNVYNLAATIANIKYSNDDVDKELIMQTQSGESDLAYFYKSKAYEEQQERRIILGENIDSLIKRGVGERFKDGIKIHIGSLSKGYIVKTVNF